MTEMDPATKAWIGRRTERQDIITPRMVAEFTATLKPHLAEAEVPPGLHWCLAPDIVPASDLGPDAHPRKGLTLPDIALPRRMWAGGELVLHGTFQTGDAVTKISTIENIAFKTGSTGKLCFVTVRHHYRARAGLIIDERQDIVYRDLPAAAAPPRPPETAPPFEASASRWQITPSPTLLFRYSALTFNGHRIHYDYPYATGVEGYRGLVVHGPLQATLMLNLVTQSLGRLPKRFSYRGLAPLICASPFTAEVQQKPEGSFEARCVCAQNIVTMTAGADA